MSKVLHLSEIDPSGAAFDQDEASLEDLFQIGQAVLERERALRDAREVAAEKKRALELSRSWDQFWYCVQHLVPAALVDFLDVEEDRNGEDPNHYGQSVYIILPRCCQMRFEVRVLDSKLPPAEWAWVLKGTMVVVQGLAHAEPVIRWAEPDLVWSNNLVGHAGIEHLPALMASARLTWERYEQAHLEWEQIRDEDERQEKLAYAPAAPAAAPSLEEQLVGVLQQVIYACINDRLNGGGE
jgi:hypothetical protein